MKSGGGGGATPTPLRLENCVPMESTTVRDADCDAADEGVKLTAMEHEVPAARDVPQVLAAMVKLEAFAPVRPIDAME